MGFSTRSSFSLKLGIASEPVGGDDGGGAPGGEGRDRRQGFGCLGCPRGGAQREPKIRLGRPSGGAQREPGGAAGGSERGSAGGATGGDNVSGETPVSRSVTGMTEVGAVRGAH